MTPGAPELELFHTGMVVGDIAAAMTQMTSAFGTCWSEVARNRYPVWTVDGPGWRESFTAFSLGGSHHIELVQGVDDSMWEAAPGGPALHHLAYWTRDLPAQIARMEAAGYRLQLGASVEGALAGFAYLHHPVGGLYIELVDETTWRRTDVGPSSVCGARIQPEEGNIE